MAQLKPAEKYVHQMRAAWLRDDEALSDGDLGAMLGSDGAPTDPSRRNPNRLTAAGLADLLAAIIERSNRRLAAVAEVFGLDAARLWQTAESAEQDGAVDRVTANMIALEREFSRRGPTARRLTKWILANGESIKARGKKCGMDREQLADALAAYFEGDNAAGRTNPDYARAVRQYLGEDDADLTDANLAAACLLLGLEHESIVERAAIMEIDTGLSRTTATMAAFWYALRDRYPDLGEYAAGLFFDSASVLLDRKLSAGQTQGQTLAFRYKEAI